MKKRLSAGALVLAALIGTVGAANARGGGGSRSGGGTTYVAPHFNSNGTFTNGHYRTAPNSTQYDNWSSKGNVNPYTGQPGTKIPRY